MGDDKPFDYSHKEVRDYYVSYIKELCENYDIDGIELDIVISGKKQLRYATSVILKAYSQSEIVCLPDEEVDYSVTKGMLRIFER